MALRWFAPSALAGCIGGCVLGFVDGLGVVVSASVALFAVSVALRAVVAAWRPEELAVALTDADGAAPRLAGWVAVIWLGAVGLGSAMYQSVWVMAVMTAFKPLAMSYAQPVVAVATAAVLVAVSRPCARLFGWIAARIDARWRRRGHRTLLRPRIILGAAAVTAVAMTYVMWRVFVRHRIAVHGGVLVGPAAGVVAMGVVHALWARVSWPRAGRGG